MPLPPKISEPGAFGDAYPGEMPQAQNDMYNDMSPGFSHDPAEFQPGSGEYKFFYGGGQLHVSPFHEHDELRGHAGIAPDHTGPVSVGYVSVDGGRANWQVSGNVALRGFARVLKDYTKQVGWQWGGLTDLNGEPVDDSFAPKKSMAIRNNETGKKLIWVKQGNTAIVPPGLDDDAKEYLTSQGFKIAEYPGGGNANDMIDNYSPMGEDLEIYNRGQKEDADFPEVGPDHGQPKGTFKCPACSQVFNNWGEYKTHRQSEDFPSIDPVDDGQFPELDMDKTIPPHFNEKRPFILPLASVREADAYDEFEDYSEWLGIGDELHRIYGAYRDGEIVGLAALRDNQIDLLRGRSELVRETLVRAAQVHHPVLVSSEDRLPKKTAMATGFVQDEHSTFHWSAGSAPKDQLDRSVPFIYDVQEDRVVVGQPGSRHSDIPGQFTPGGIVEGDYLPGGKVHIHTMTNMSYSVRHLIQLWYWSYPHMEVTGVELHDSAGNKTKLASTRISTTSVGSYIKQLALTDPAVWNSYKALADAGGKVYVVGGAVRDALLQKEPKDIDLMVAGIPTEEVNTILHGLPGRVDLTGKNFGVYRYKDKGHEVEIALPRTETSTGDRRVNFDVKVDHNLPVEDDLLRRDFTVNSMAVDLSNGELIDPYGGADDIEHRRLHTTHPSSFQEDPTRLVRGLVMSGRYGLHPDERTRHEIEENAHRIDLESPDAVQPILEKLFASTNPARAIRLAHETGLLKHLFPEVEHNWDFDQNNPHHSYSLGEHLVTVLDNISHQTSDPDLRIAALLHDIGKPASAWQNPETGFNHYYRGKEGQGDDHEIVGGRMAEQRLRALKWPTARIKRIKHIIDHHMWPAFSSSKGARKYLHRVGDEHGDDLLTFRWADQHGKGQTPAELSARTSVDTQRGLVEQVRSAQAPTSQSALSVNGSDIIGLGVKAGPDVGQILRRLTDDVVDDPRLNDRDLLLERAQEYVNAIA